jgi:hypothetical protein
MKKRITLNLKRIALNSPMDTPLCSRFSQIPELLQQYHSNIPQRLKYLIKTQLRTAWYCVYNIPNGIKNPDTQSNIFFSSIDTNPESALVLFEEKLKISFFLTYEKQVNDWLKRLGTLKKEPSDILNQLSTALQAVLVNYRENPLPNIEIPEDHAYVKIVLGALPDPNNPENVVSLNYIKFKNLWTPIHNHPIVMADGIVSGVLQEWVLTKTKTGIYEKLEENRYTEGSILADYNTAQRWHITKADSEDPLVILNAYYGPADQHVVDAESASPHQLLGLQETDLYPGGLHHDT